MRDSNVINEETNGLDMLLPAVLRQQTAQKIQKKKKKETLLLQVLSYPAGRGPSMTGAGFYSLTEIYSHPSITSKYLNECLDNYTQRCLNCCVYMPKRGIGERNA